MGHGHSSLNILCCLMAKASDLDWFLAGLALRAPRVCCGLSWVLGDFTLGSSKFPFLSGTREVT